MKTLTVFLLLAVLAGSQAWAATIDDVEFLTRIQTYETIVDTTLVTQEGKQIPLHKGTTVNVAGFTKTEAFVISRSDRPNGFIKKTDLAPARRSNAMEFPPIKEKTIQ
ncbi:MAG TPA: hypothetical protein VLX11_16685 [Candidatus Acidoferrales bacterium]|nr:hypothetical protein [Candidatus Acidoferrales bacterium]